MNSSKKLNKTSSSKFELKLTELRHAWRDRHGDDYASPDADIAFVDRKKERFLLLHIK